MSPTSRNTLMIGGALILIALLLVCGPLSGRFGGAGSSVDEAPAVAAGPPGDHTGALGTAAIGAIAGASLGDSAAAQLAAQLEAETLVDPCEGDRGDADDMKMALGDTDCPPVSGDAAAVIAGAGVAGAVMTAEDDDSGKDANLAVPVPVVVPVVVAPVVAVAGAADGIGGGSGLGTAAVDAPLGKVDFPTPVAADLPDVGAAGPGISDAMEMAAALTATGFDRAIAASTQSSAGVGAAGKVVDRFAPPVASPPTANLNVASSLNVPVLIRPCDTPGSGCRNLAATGGGTPPTGGNPPIIPGRLPPVPSGAP